MVINLTYLLTYNYYIIVNKYNNNSVYCNQLCEESAHAVDCSRNTRLNLSIITCLKWGGEEGRRGDDTFQDCCMSCNDRHRVKKCDIN